MYTLKYFKCLLRYIIIFPIYHCFLRLFVYIHKKNSARFGIKSIVVADKVYFKRLSRCLSFVFLRIIINAQTYHEKYLTEIEHDNVYVTSYFRKIDARRKARGSLTLLPLKKIERSKFVDPYSLRPGKVERVNLVGQTVKLILEMISVTTFILMDRLFFEALDLVRRHSYMEYTQVRDSQSDSSTILVISSQI